MRRNSEICKPDDNLTGRLTTEVHLSIWYVAVYFALVAPQRAIVVMSQHDAGNVYPNGPRDVLKYLAECRSKRGS